MSDVRDRDRKPVTNDPRNPDAERRREPLPEARDPRDRPAPREPRELEPRAQPPVEPRAQPPAEPRHEAAEAAHEAILGHDAASFRHEWEEIQAGFVDDPRHSVEKADALVARAAQRLADAFAQERGRLEGEWGRGGDVSTEDLRMALRRYRAFFDRLLSI